MSDEQPTDGEQQPTKSRARVQSIAGRVPDGRDGAHNQSVQPMFVTVLSPHPAKKPASKWHCRMFGHEANRLKWGTGFHIVRRTVWRNRKQAAQMKYV